MPPARIEALELLTAFVRTWWQTAFSPEYFHCIPGNGRQIAFPLYRVFYSQLFQIPMSQHPSLKSGGGAVGAKRSVLKRFERVKLLKKRGQWKEGQSALNLPKTTPDI